MTEEKINRAIYSVCKWDYRCVKDGGLDFANSLDAMAEAECFLEKGKRQFYVEELQDVCKKQIFGHFLVVTATARQRAEAFLRTLSLWEEVQK